MKQRCNLATGWRAHAVNILFQCVFPKQNESCRCNFEFSNASLARAEDMRDLLEVSNPVLNATVLDPHGV
jgi:hypothetical protein